LPLSCEKLLKYEGDTLARVATASPAAKFLTGEKRIFVITCRVIFLPPSSSFSELFTSYSHVSSSLPPAGLRLRTGGKCDKKKSELYFFEMVEKNLTNFHARRSPRARRFCLSFASVDLPGGARRFPAWPGRTDQRDLA
jgi:hypothetical protein